jgi:hypothetical protein
MKDFFLKHYASEKDKINELFMDHTLNNNNEYFNKFKSLHKALNNEDYEGASIELNMPFMYYNNFNIINVDVWNKPEIQDIVNKIDEQGYIFYCRWGDAPLQTIILSLYDNTRITKVNFKYSKRLQREAFKDDEGKLHSFMPSDYDNNSCVIKNTKK